ncbi:hypothetical protein L226DRAFT_193383 [Lentinus tigrinus ALCF2SS1-7]|uniref:Uncharacterized protein n=1 Tax=Lentinus tigrinus ALCF2SS1-6 TaxID=1328759 RepID=A0A5C2SS69_9APHY|nr:hypothetical protein L227DRAFT_138460 [Lentinus tigrinus ALCF2SS1-6]RPD80196.1 hypothetical protein L226DRAFT_193383 [Lentinus tigrinus ALCF2SS1-7]
MRRFQEYLESIEEQIEVKGRWGWVYERRSGISRARTVTMRWSRLLGLTREPHPRPSHSLLRFRSTLATKGTGKNWAVEQIDASHFQRQRDRPREDERRELRLRKRVHPRPTALDRHAWQAVHYNHEAGCHHGLDDWLRPSSPPTMSLPSQPRATSVQSSLTVAVASTEV